jgi:hypothetical protein
MGSLMDFINNQSLAELRNERDKLAQIEEEKKRERDEATKGYHAAVNARVIADQAVEMKLATETVGARKLVFTKAPDGPVGLDQTTAILNLIRQNDGLKPRQIDKLLKGQGFDVRGYYVNTVLQRLKKRGEVYTRDGKYFPSGQGAAIAE